MNMSDTKDNQNKFLAQNEVTQGSDSNLLLDSEEVDSIESQNIIDSSVIE